MAPADLTPGIGFGLGHILALFQFHLVKACAQHRPGGRAVLVLRAIALALHRDAGRQMGDAHRAFGLVDMLPARAGSAIDIDAHILFGNVDIDLVVDNRKNAYRGKAGMPACIGIERRNPHQAVNPRLRLQPAIGVVPLDHNSGRFDPGFLALALLDEFHLVALALGPARIHAQQHTRPILGLRAARACVNFQIGVVGVRLAREHGFQLHRPGARLQAGQHVLALGNQLLVALVFGKFDQRHGVAEFTLKTPKSIDGLGQPRAFAHQALRFLRSGPEIGVFGFGVQLVEAALGIVRVKDASSAAQATARFCRWPVLLRRA